MNKKDIERMISLADDRYIDELFTDRISGRQKNIVLSFAAVAAALAVVAGGIGYFVSNAGDADKITADVSGTSVSDNAVYNAEQPFNYKELFKNKLEEGSENLLRDFVIDGQYTPEDFATGDKKTVFGDEYTKSVMPFDAGYFNCAETTLFYGDSGDSIEFIRVQLGKNIDRKADKMCRVTVCREGALLSLLDLNGFISTPRLGAEVYGFEMDWREDSNKGVVFLANGSEYMVEGVINMTYDDLGVIIDALIEKGVSASDFDVLRGQSTEGHYGKPITLAEANLTAPFAGYIPVSTRIGNMELKEVTYSESSQNSIVDNKYIDIDYVCDEPYSFIRLSYGTFREDPMNTVPLGDILDRLDGFAKPADTDGVFSYTFAVECGEFWIKVWAKCPSEEMALCMSDIKGDPAVVLRDITLEEAKEDPLTSGYVPSAVTIGSMSLENGVCKAEENRGSRRIIVKYSDPSFKFNDERYDPYGKYLTAAYSKYDSSDTDAMLLEDTEIDPQFDLNDSGVSKYKFAVRCGDTRISVEALCNHGEMAQFLKYLKEIEKIKEEAARQHEEEKRTAEWNALAERLLKGGDEVLTMEKVKELAKKGDALDWEDFTDFSGTEGGSGLFIMSYKVEGTDYYVNVGGGPYEKPYVHLNDKDGGNYIDLRRDSVDDFINSKTSKTLTLDKVKELAKKGDDLTWSDFDGYVFSEGGSGLYIRTYTVEEGYSLYIGGGSLDDKPMYIYLSGKGKSGIDIRYESVDEFLGEKVPLHTVDSENGNLLTIEKVKELAKKGDDLTWSDFEEFSGTDVGSGMYIMVYPVEDTDYRVTVGGSPDRKPMYIHFGTGDGNYIDLRSDSLDDYLNEKPFINYEF